MKTQPFAANPANLRFLISVSFFSSVFGECTGWTETSMMWGINHTARLDHDGSIVRATFRFGIPYTIESVDD
jgi:hypothetical protein